MQIKSLQNIYAFWQRNPISEECTPKKHSDTETASCSIHVHIKTPAATTIRLRCQTELHRTAPLLQAYSYRGSQGTFPPPAPEVKRSVRTEHRRRPRRREKPVSDTAGGRLGGAEEALHRQGRGPPLSEGKAVTTHGLAENPPKATGKCSRRDWQDARGKNHKCRSLMCAVCARKTTQILYFLFIYHERERERGRGGERDRDRLPSRLHAAQCAARLRAGYPGP